MFNSERIKYGQGIASMFDTSKNIYTATIRPYYKIKHNLYDKKLEALVYSSSIVRGFKKKGYDTLATLVGLTGFEPVTSTLSR